MIGILLLEFMGVMKQRAMKSRSVRWVEHVVCFGYKILIGKSERKRPLQRCKHRCDKNECFNLLTENDVQFIFSLLYFIIINFCLLLTSPYISRH